jgi:hypothetical protein
MTKPTYLLPDFLEQCEKFGGKDCYQVLTDSESTLRRTSLHAAYPSMTKNSPLMFYGGAGLQTDEPSQYLHLFLTGKTVFFGFPNDQEPTIVKLSDGGILAKVVSEMNYFIEYWITDAENTFLLGESHSGILVGLGQAESWVRALTTNG